jgi:hypothetical protein
VFIHDPEDLTQLQIHMERYCAASNAKFNHDKIQAFSVSGRDTWETWKRPLTQMHIKHLQSV